MNNFTLKYHADIELKRANHQFGAAFVEFALVLPFFILFISLAWDQMVDLVCEIRHESAALQLTLNFQDPALTVLIDRTDPSFPKTSLSKLGVSNITELTGTTLNPSTGFLPRLNQLFNNIMNNIGSFSEYVDHNLAIELWYVRVCSGLTGSGGASADCVVNGTSYVPGQAYEADRAGAGSQYATQNGQTFFVSPGGEECFGSATSQTFINAKASFDSYVQQRINMILANSSAEPFGVEIINIPAIGQVGAKDDGTSILSGFSAIDAYLEYRPILFMAMCSKPPKILSSEPVVTNMTMFLDGGMQL